MAMITNIIEQAKALTLQERIELVKLLVDTLGADAPPQHPKRRLSELRGLGKELWAGIDAQAYVDQIRDEWDARP